MKKIKLFFAIFIAILGIFGCSLLVSNIFLNKDIQFKEITINTDVAINSTIQYLSYEGEYELPINGATGYASIDMALKELPSSDSNTIISLKAGDGFTIISEQGSWWEVKYDNNIGYVKHKYCLINLPDIIPSIIYNNTNSYKSMFMTSGYEIDNITGEQLYDTNFYNYRLKENIYVVPVLYSMAKKINKAQQKALANNETLIIYEGYRPYETQRKVVNNVKKLANNNKEVSKGINTRLWHMTWFISTRVSNHQIGMAIDVSLGKVNKLSEKVVGNYIIKYVSDYEEYEMPSKMHELSTKSLRYTSPVPSNSKTAWKKATYSKAMKNNEPAQRLEKYCTESGLTPLASEWWHYNDLDCLKNKTGIGNYTIKHVYSTIPIIEQ